MSSASSASSMSSASSAPSTASATAMYSTSPASSTASASATASPSATSATSSTSSTSSTASASTNSPASAESACSPAVSCESTVSSAASASAGISSAGMTGISPVSSETETPPERFPRLRRRWPPTGGEPMIPFRASNSATEIGRESWSSSDAVICRLSIGRTPGDQDVAPQHPPPASPPRRFRPLHCRVAAG